MVEPAASKSVAADLLVDEIRSRLGFVPIIYRELQCRPDLLAATWAQHCRVLPDGTADGLARCVAALAVAAADGCRYWVDFHTAMLRRAGVRESDLEGILAAISFAGGATALAQALGQSQAVDPELLPHLPHRGRPL